MAIMTSLLGFCSGRIGNMIFYQRNGKACVRSGPRKTNRAATPRQLAQRAKFALVAAFLHPLRSFLQEDARIKNGKIPLFNRCVRRALQQSVIGQYPDFQLDYPKLEVSRGPLGRLHGLDFAECSTDLFAAGDGLSTIRQVKLTWKCIGYSFTASNDLVRIMLYNTTSKSFSFHEDAFRSDEKTVIDLSGALAGDTLHAYVFMESISGQRSNSQYAGEVVMG